jgi:hypothetical protein
MEKLIRTLDLIGCANGEPQGVHRGITKHYAEKWLMKHLEGVYKLVEGKDEEIEMNRVKSDGTQWTETILIHWNK